MKHNCPICHNKIEGYRADAVYCSDACRVKAYRLRKEVIAVTEEG